ncbi:phosphatase PAP2 family protein [Pseudoxanthomonas suwonensis]|uniref:phosphatase PAP2 family protein n=1 Tax=Pseudoxanthomonas suwonensis TaxID=314722 RepID=UPI000684F10C|nr:phosphatase PAP2 family protein [Pseudoxanthomonas suwonensis]
MSADWRIFVLPGSAWCVLPLVAVLGTALAVRDPSARGPVVRWWNAIAVAVVLVAASKIAFYGWGTGVRAWDLTCFSGHTVLGLVFWPVALALLVPPRYRGWRVSMATAGWVFAGLIGVSRVMLRAHPLSEVLAGAVLGAIVGGYGLHVLRGHRWPRVWGTGVVAVCLIVTLWLDPRSMRLPDSERGFAQIGATLAGNEKPVSRRAFKDVKPAPSHGARKVPR